MLDNIGKLPGQARDVFTALPMQRRIVVLAGAALLISGFVVLLIWVNRPQYATLFSNLSAEDAGAIAQQLKDRKIPYELAAGGSAILVRDSDVHQVRLDLASEGLPRGGAVGLEIFDETSAISTTSFIQNLRYQQALQGELERTIKKFQEVDEARVHLTIPKESVFLDEKREPTASVWLKMSSHRTLSQAQILGIVHLVASSVEGLETRNVTIVDASGGLIYKQEEESDGLLTETQLNQQKNLEQSLASRITTMLERVVGPGKAVARVNAELNFKQVSTTEEAFNPDQTVIRSEQRLNEKNTGAQTASGAPTARYDLDPTRANEQTQDQNRETYEKTEETINYDITRVQRQTIIPAGEVIRLSVAVIVDGIYKDDEGGQGRVFTPRPQEELAQLKELVSHAIGYDKDRGDSVVVNSFPFFVPEEAKASLIDTSREVIGKIGLDMKVVVTILALLFLFYLGLVFLRWLKQEANVVSSGEEESYLPHLEAAALEEPDRRADAEASPEKASQLAKNNPDRAVDILRAWINER